MSRLKRAADVRRRLASECPRDTQCAVLGCSDPTRSSAGEGFDLRLCQRHAEAYSRHGSPWRRSYRAAEYQPHRDSALRWLRANQERLEVSGAEHRVKRLLLTAGPAEPAFRLRGMKPRERATVAWARLRANRVDPLRPVAAWLAIERTIASDPEADTRPEFARVQSAKLVHRMASGTRKVWEQPGQDASKRVTRLEVYPRSRGQVLRHIGNDLEMACEPLLDVEWWRD